MRQLHTESHFRHALFALQDADGYVEALLEMARGRVADRRNVDRFGSKPKSAPTGERKSPSRH